MSTTARPPDDDDDILLAARAKRRNREARRKLLAAIALIIGAGGLATGSVLLLRGRLQDAEVAAVEPTKKDAPPRPVAPSQPAPPPKKPAPQPQPQQPPRQKKFVPQVVPPTTFDDPPVSPPAFFPMPGGGPFALPQSPQKAPVSLGPEEPDPQFKSDRPKKEASPGYFQRSPLGFQMAVSRLAYEESDAAFGRPLKMIDDELARLSDVLPDAAVKALKAVPVWVEWDHTIPQNVHTYGVYYGRGREWDLFTEGVDPRKSGCVCLLSLKTAYRLRREGQQKNVLLHEFAHVYHDRALGLDNAFVENPYEQARARRLYIDVKHDDGTTRPAYATRNAREYFAELTCAYLDRVDYYPHNRAELRVYDSVGYEMMTRVWGTPEQMDEARRRRSMGRKN